MTDDEGSKEGGNSEYTLADRDDPAWVESDGEKAPLAEPDFPEGGFRAWLCVAGAWASMAVTFGYLNCFGVFEEYYLSHQLSTYSSSAIAWIGAIQYFLLFFSGILVGRLFDLGFFRPTLTVGCVILVFSQMMLSLCKTYWQIFLAQGIGLGLAFGVIFNLAVNCPAHYFSKRRALAYGFVASGSSIGGTVFPIMINRLLVQVGYPWTMRIVGFLTLVLCILASVGLSTRLKPVIDVRDKSKGGWKQVHFFDFTAFKLPAYTFFVLGSTFILFGLYTPFTFMDVATRSYNLPGSGYYLSVLNAASTFGRILPGIVADRAGRINTILPHLAVSAILLFIYPLCTNLPGIIIFSILYGFASGAYVSLIPACVSQLGSTHNVGQRVGMMFMIGSIGALFGQPIAGAILGSGPYRWWPTSVYSAIMVAVGTALIALSRHFALGRNIKGKI